jgi:hypothetical protein
MLDSGVYVLIGMREWVVEDVTQGGSGGNKGIRYCDLLEVYNSMERDILRRTHNVFSTLKDETGNKVDDGDNSVMFVDDNTLKYQGMIKKMEKKSGSEESGESDDDCIEQSVVITTNVKHVGKGIIEQSFDISDDEGEEDEGEEEEEGEGEDDTVKPTSGKVSEYKIDNQTEIPSASSYNKKKIVYHQESEINVDDI